MSLFKELLATATRAYRNRDPEFRVPLLGEFDLIPAVLNSYAGEHIVGSRGYYGTLVDDGFRGVRLYGLDNKAVLELPDEPVLCSPLIKRDYYEKAYILQGCKYQVQMEITRYQAYAFLKSSPFYLMTGEFATMSGQGLCNKFAVRVTPPTIRGWHGHHRPVDPSRVCWVYNHEGSFYLVNEVA